MTEDEMDEHFKKPTFIERCKHSFGSFFKDGFKGAAVGLAVGAVVGAAFAFGLPLITGATIAGGALAAVGKMALISGLFGGALHATMGAIEAFSNAGNELDVNKDKDAPEPAKAKEVEKGRGLAITRETEAPGINLGAEVTNFRERIAQQKLRASQQVEQRY